MLLVYSERTRDRHTRISRFLSDEHAGITDAGFGWKRFQRDIKEPSNQPFNK
jgi:hypothetical protein